jgi:hypothetical protein
MRLPRGVEEGAGLLRDEGFLQKTETRLFLIGGDILGEVRLGEAYRTPWALQTTESHATGFDRVALGVFKTLAA